MPEPFPQTFQLWDYGWLHHDQISIKPCRSSLQIVSAYLKSEAFGRSFASPPPDEAPDLHGPFRRDAIGEPDFLVITADQLAAELAPIRQPRGFDSPATDSQWQPVENLLSELARNSTWIIALRLNEENKDRFHDWGFVLWLFREYLFASPGTDRLDRCVFGYD